MRYSEIAKVDITTKLFLEIKNRRCMTVGGANTRGKGGWADNITIIMCITGSYLHDQKAPTC